MYSTIPSEFQKICDKNRQVRLILFSLLLDDITGSSSISDNILPESEQDAITVMIQEPPETLQQENDEVIYEDEIQILGLVYQYTDSSKIVV